MSGDDAAAPPGWTRAPVGGVFATHNGPLFARWIEGRLEIGFRVGPNHVNPGNACHGGMLATLADIVLSTAAHHQADIPRQFLPTVSLQCDFLAPAPLGSWVAGRAEILRVTRRLLFSQGLLHAGDTLVVRASGVFRRGPLLPDSASDDTLRLPGLPERRVSAGG